MTSVAACHLSNSVSRGILRKNSHIVMPTSNDARFYFSQSSLLLVTHFLVTTAGDRNLHVFNGSNWETAVRLTITYCGSGLQSEARLLPGYGPFNCLSLIRHLIMTRSSKRFDQRQRMRCNAVPSGLMTGVRCRRPIVVSLTRVAGVEHRPSDASLGFCTHKQPSLHLQITGNSTTAN